MAVILTWAEFALFGALVAYLFVVLRYMVASMFNNSEMKSLSIIEIQSIIFTLIIFATFSALDYSSQINAAKKTIESYYSDSMDIYKGITASVTLLSILASFGIQPNIGSFISKSIFPEQAVDSLYVGITPFSVFSPLITAISFFQSFLGISFIGMQMHIKLLEMISTTGKSVLFPLGIFLRAFKITRDGGNALIALFLALYVMYPLTIDFIDYVIKEKYSECKNVNILQFGNLMFNEVMAAKFFDMPTDIISLVPGSKESIRLTDYIKGLKSNMCKYKNNIPNLIGNFIVIIGFKGMFAPIFALIIALGFARVFAGILGTEVDFSSLVRVI
ncbi:MAG: hypothetical protein ACP5KJ_03135 [Candidatus Micrarchaeia archaeon]